MRWLMLSWGSITVRYLSNRHTALGFFLLRYWCNRLDADSVSTPNGRWWRQECWIRHNITSSFVVSIVVWKTRRVSLLVPIPMVVTITVNIIKELLMPMNLTTLRGTRNEHHLSVLWWRRDMVLVRSPLSWRGLRDRHIRVWEVYSSSHPVETGLEWAEARLDGISASKWPWLGDKLGMETDAWAWTWTVDYPASEAEPRSGASLEDSSKIGDRGFPRLM